MTIWFSFATWISVSVVVPPTLCVAGSVWLRHRFTLGGWVVAVGVVVGVLAAVNCLRCSLQALDRQGKTAEHKEPPSVSFNNH